MVQHPFQRDYRFKTLQAEDMSKYMPMPIQKFESCDLSAEVNIAVKANGYQWTL